ncbi:MAG: site-specific DNA-methyltransferase [Pyrinomonadaceae bacterium]
MTAKQKLELTWIGKENRPRLEPRILLEDPSLSHHASHRVTENDIFDNRLIFGDNLLALKALEQEFAGKIKCIYIDPPYNTGSAFEHYDDGVEHSLWLSLMRDRLEILHNLLRLDGMLWLQLDDNEVFYAKALLDEIFGRKNFVSSVVWQKVFARKNKAVISSSHDTLLLYARDIVHVQRNLIGRTEEQLKAFRNLDNDARGLWQSVAYSVQSEDSVKRIAYRYPIELPSGRSVMPPAGRHWNGLPDRTASLRSEGRLWFGPEGDSPPRFKLFLAEVQEGIVPDSWWSHKECGNNQEAKKEMISLFSNQEPFSTAKPERLIRRVLEISTAAGDFVLDSFAGSGTTGAVAQKMGRRWIMVELREHCHTHIIPRLRKVIEGEDPGGITEAVGWKGGGGFRYYRLAPSLLEKDKWGNWVINKEYNAAMLAEALCKLEGFTYAPSDSIYWQHGHSTERDFSYITTAHLTHDQLQQLSDEVGSDLTLLVLCTAFRARPDQFPNLTVKKIPKAVLSRCEYGHDDYSLQVENLPQAPPERGQQALFDEGAEP